MVVDDEGLAAHGGGGEFAEVSVLDRLHAVRGDGLKRGPDAVVGIGEDEITA